MMKSFHLRSGIGMVVAASSCLILVSGCGSKDTGTTVSESAAEIQARQQANIDKVKNDPNIPPAQKEMILGRMQSSQQEAAARTAAGPPKGNAPALPGPKSGQ